MSAIDSNGRTIWIADAHRGDGNHFGVRANEKPTAFLDGHGKARFPPPHDRAHMISARSSREISLRSTDRVVRSDCFHDVSCGELHVGSPVLCRKSRTGPCGRTSDGIRTSSRTARFLPLDFPHFAARTVSTDPRKPRSASIRYVAIRRRLGAQTHFHPWIITPHFK